MLIFRILFSDVKVRIAGRIPERGANVHALRIKKNPVEGVRGASG
jgi:hypothetical protein